MKTHKIKLPSGLVVIRSEEEVEAIYRFREKQYRLQDAEHLFYDCIENLSEEEFEKKYGFSVEEATNPESEHYILLDLVEMFEDHFDCNLAENDIWDTVISYYLAKIEERTLS